MKKKEIAVAKTQELVLHEVSQDMFNRCYNNLNDHLKSTDLQDLADELRRWLQDKEVVSVDSQGLKTPCKAVNEYFQQKRHCKDDALNFMATFLVDDYNTQVMMEAMSELEKEILKECLDHFYVSVDDLSERKGIERIYSVGKDRWSGDVTYVLNSSWFILVNESIDYDEENVYMSVLPCLYFYFHRAFYGEVEENFFQELPEGESLRVMKTEESAHRAFPLVLNMYERGEFENSGTGKLKVSVVRKCAQQLGDFEEFFPNSTEQGQKYLRASLYFTFIMYRLGRKLLKSSKKSLRLEEALKEDARDALLPFPRLTINALLPHVTGISSTWDTSYCYYLFTDVWLELIDYVTSSTAPVWIPIQGIYKGILNENKGMQELHLFSTSDYYFSMGKLKNGKKNKEVITKDRFRAEVSEPYLKALFLMMASAGLFDVAFREEREEDASWVDSLQYVRMTDLGKYVFGFSKTYEPHFEEKKVDYFDIDQERLIIRSLVEKNPYDSFLTEVAKPIGNQRYVFTEESFIRKCQTKQEIQSKIDFFVRFISPKLSPVWQDFFDGIQEKCNPFVSLRISEYSMFQVAPEKKELIHLLNTDAKLRQLVIRAEGYIFLLKDESRKEFKERLKSLGYIL